MFVCGYVGLIGGTFVACAIKVVVRGVDVYAQ